MPRSAGSRRTSGARLRLSILADPIGPGPGGTRFIRRFIDALLKAPAALERIEKLTLVLSQGSAPDFLGPLPDNTRVVQRRFPFSMRHTALASIMGCTLPRAEVAHGLSFYVFPRQGKRSLVTFHDASFMHEDFQDARQKRLIGSALMAAVFPRCDAVVCISDTVAKEVRSLWPQVSSRCVRIYWGVSPIGGIRSPFTLEGRAGGKRAILAVGTVEPRKNYEQILNAYEQLVAEEGQKAPGLTVVGQPGWMCEAVQSRLNRMESLGKAKWLRNASDAVLADAYSNASVFTYLSLYEGFGYPPFEAALAGVPMVLSNQSAVGEIWAGHACCVDPTDTREVVAAWKWALGLREAERWAVIKRQRSHAEQFTWDKCAASYLDLYERIATAEDASRYRESQ